ncbi:MAG: hypothetical protein WAQ28_04165 [Bacteroidia bacterium]
MISYLIIVLFTLAVLLGMYLLSFVVRAKETPKSIAFFHGIVAATALIMLIIYSVDKNERIVASAVILTFAAVGGIIYFIKDITGKPLPKWFAITHGLVAEIGFIVFLFYLYT